MGLFPEIEPHDHGMLDVGDGNHMYWEICGNPLGKPAVMLHGGPGSGSNRHFRRYFNPDIYRIVLFDQRGCGRSTPHASAFDTDMSVNTTAHLIADLELLRRHLEIERWLVWGVSWGSVLGLRYAQTHPGAVSEMVLTAVATGADREVSLMTRGLGQYFPDAFQHFLEELPEDERGGNLAAAYNRLIESPDPEVRARRRAPGPIGRRQWPLSRRVPSRVTRTRCSAWASLALSRTIGATATFSVRTALYCAMPSC